MKPIKLFPPTALLLLGTAITSNAWFISGHVYCDVNTNSLIDGPDVQVENVVVVVTNTSGTFSNASWTDADGFFLIPLADFPDTYADFIPADALPPGTTAVVPTLNSFTVADATILANDFLIQNPACVSPRNVPMVAGHIYCDANSNNVIDLGDLPVPYMLVAVTNVSGTFSNFTSADVTGFFSMQLPPVADSYGDFIPILPSRGTIVLPGQNHAHQFSIPTGASSNAITNDFLIRSPSCGGAFEIGQVYCDANTNGLVDSVDVPVPRVLVVVTNVSGTFSNVNLTTTAGAFSIVLPGVSDTYVDFLLGPTLPAGTRAVLPPPKSFLVTNGMTVTHNFLIENPACAISIPSPFKVGHVYCDVNTNGLIDSADTPVGGALVIVTNFSGTFSNADFTDANGFFSIRLPEVTDLYGDYLEPSSLLAGTAVVVPGENQVYPFSILTPNPSQIVTNDFLVRNPACVTDPPVNTGYCSLIGSGTIKSAKGKILHSFGCVVNPSRSAVAVRGRNWTDTDFTRKLQFKGMIVQVLDCGGVPDRNGSNYIEFQGMGNLNGIGKNKVDYGTVRFFGRAEHFNEPRHRPDRLYLRVFDSVGNTLLLISADSANPLDIAPVAVSTGKLKMRSWK